MRMTKEVIKKGADSTKTGGTKFWIQTIDKKFYSSFKADVGAAIEGIRDGDVVEFEIEEKHGKDRNGNPVVYQNIGAIIGIQQGSGGSSSPAPEGGADPVSYDRRQHLIVRQSCLSTAVAALNASGEGGMTMDNLLATAAKLEEWVWRE